VPGARDARWRGVDPAGAVEVLRAHWAKGHYLRDLATGVAWKPVAVPLRPPTARQVSEDLGAVTTWVEKWHRVRGFRVETATVGGRLLGANALPVRAWVDDPEALWGLLGVGEDVARFHDLCTQTLERRPDVAAWLEANPMAGLRLAPIWPRLLDLLDWMVEHAGPEVYLRQIDVPGVDTKFVERYRSELGELLDVVLPAERVDVAHPRSRFVERYRLARKPSYVRMRRLDGSSLLAGGGPAELALRVTDLSATPLECTRVVVVENEVTYLALPRVEGMVAVLGEGYAVTRLAPLAWLREAPMSYWGDIDTHGLLMLDRMRGHFPQVRSMLMNHDALLAHEPHWDTELVQATASPDRLTQEEAALYRDLLENRFGVQVRLEQERIRFSTVDRALREEH